MAKLPQAGAPASPDHGAFTGSHSHPHPAFGSQGDDGSHSHMHTHTGDAAHQHDHAGHQADEPSGSDVHVDGPLKVKGQPVGLRWGGAKLTPAFLHDLKERIQTHVRGGNTVDDATFSDMVGKARGKAISVGHQVGKAAQMADDAAAASRPAQGPQSTQVGDGSQEDDPDDTAGSEPKRYGEGFDFAEAAAYAGERLAAGVGYEQVVGELIAMADEYQNAYGVDWDAGAGEAPEIEDLEEDAPHLFKSDARVQYRAADTPGEMCASCRFYDSDDLSCRFIEGQIRPQDTCNLYDPAFLIDASERDRDIATLCATHPAATAAGEPTSPHGLRLFNELPAPISAAEPPDEFEYLPRPGEYQHPKWGPIKITRERNERFAATHNSHLYQEEIPIDAEHLSKQSGPMAYVGALRMNQDGSVTATQVRWTGRGRTMMEADAFKYFSPEWYDEWQDPATGEVHKDVPIGGALTSRPFFKEKSLRPLVASERGIEVGSDDPASYRDAGETLVVHFDAMQAIQGNTSTARATGEPSAASQPGAKQQDGPRQPRPATEGGTMAVDPKAFVEMQARVTELTAKAATEEAARTAAESQLKLASETITVLATESRRKRFTDLALGRSGAGDGSPRWFGEVENHVAILESLAMSEGGEESAAFKAYVANANATAAQLKASGLFQELGANENANAKGSGTSGYDQLEAEVGRILAAGEAKSTAEAWAKAYENKPKAAAEYTNALRHASQDISPSAFGE